MIILLIILVLWFIADPASAGIFLVALLVGGIIYFLVKNQESNELADKEQEMALRKFEIKSKAEEVVQNKISKLIEKYGAISNTVRLEKWSDIPDIKRCLIVFGESELLFVDGKEVLFKDIISYNIADDYRIKHGNVEYTSTTNTSTGSLLGRSAAGAVLGGGVGAVIGASSVSKNTTTIGTQSDDTIIHNYYLSINIRSLKYPLIRIELGDSTQKVEEINAILTYIINR